MNITFKVNVIVCLCHVVSHREVDRILDEGAQSVEEVASACAAGTRCGKCRPMIHDRIEAKKGSCGGCADCPARRECAA